MVDTPFIKASTPYWWLTVSFGFNYLTSLFNNREFADRSPDWQDIRGTLIRPQKLLDWDLVDRELSMLAERKQDPHCHGFQQNDGDRMIFIDRCSVLSTGMKLFCHHYSVTFQRYLPPTTSLIRLLSAPFEEFLLDEFLTANHANVRE